MSTTPPAAPKKRSWLSAIGEYLGKILGIVQKAEPTAVGLASVLLPQFAPEIALAEDIYNKIVKEAIAAEGALAAAGQATGSGAQKLEMVLSRISPVLDAWVTNNFKGAHTVSAVAKSGLVSAVVAILNELDPPPAATTP
jgi:hypothetical protein